MTDREFEVDLVVRDTASFILDVPDHVDDEQLRDRIRERIDRAGARKLAMRYADDGIRTDVEPVSATEIVWGNEDGLEFDFSDESYI